MPDSIATDNVPPEQRAEFDRHVEEERQATERVDAVRRELEELAGEEAPDDRHIDRELNLLELNGYNAVRHEVRTALGALAAIPLDALEAALSHANRMMARVRAGDHPRRDEALRAAEADVVTLKLARGVLRDLKNADERQAARNRITAR